jgi:acetate kinase
MEHHEQSSSSPAFLAVNAGSTSIKFALLNTAAPHGRIFDGAVEGIGPGAGNFHVEEEAASFSRSVVIPDVVTAVDLLMDWLLERLRPADLIAIGHRVVYGGNGYRTTQEVSTPLLDALFAATSFDSEHLPQTIRLIETLRHAFPAATHIACFDTAFHRTMPRVASMLPIPRKFYGEGVARLGFHGLSCAFLMLEMARLAGQDPAAGKVVLAHLGGGCSVTAVNAGRSCDTSMGLTPAGGMMMACRSGDIDPGLAWRLQHDHQVSSAQFNHMVNRESGLQGVSGISGDLRLLLESESAKRGAADAVDMFCYQARKQVCAMAAAMEGIDTLVFSGGAGEHLAALRTRICAGLAFLGIEIDEGLNAVHAPVISTGHSAVTVRVIHTDEQWMIAHEMRSLLDRPVTGATPGTTP